LNALVRVSHLHPATVLPIPFTNFHFSRSNPNTHQLLGGWAPKTGELPNDIEAQISLAFGNVDINLRDAGGKGWDQVCSIKTYHVGLNNEALELTKEYLKMWCPNHQPIWTVLGVEKLALPEMMIEVEVTAHDPESGNK
jgi:enamine deaminase RidA (YjgF/YER057c/UK114 family)